ncbi:hypothetical protein [Kribbella sp. DT2]|uniref:hypothetical protein n=1 Tax=Kribbella sp. DT2 TaxID=3393427 RepID=UPI003CEA23A8
MTDMAGIDRCVTQFAGASSLRLIPTVPERDFGPEVHISPDIMELEAFLQVAASAGGGLLYHQTTRFVPDPAKLAEADAKFAQHTGELAAICVAFAANGLVHFWEKTTTWYAEWREMQAPVRASWSAGGDLDDSDDSDDEGLDEALIEQILADPQFRASKLGPARQRFLRLTYGDQSWREHREASDRADELSREIYEPLRRQLDSLASELVATDAYRSCGSAAGRKEAAELFLVSRADGFMPPVVVRDELAARAQRLAKTSQQATLI